jgi:hypothetical protein
MIPPMVRSVSTVLSGQAWRAAEPLAGEHPVALSGANRINRQQVSCPCYSQECADACDPSPATRKVQINVSDTLHDLHQPAVPPDGLVEGEELGAGRRCFRRIRFPMIDDPHNREIAGIRLTSSRFSSRLNYSHKSPSRLAWHRQRRQATFLVLPSSTTCKVLVLEIWDAIRRNQWLNDLDDEHDQ